MLNRRTMIGAGMATLLIQKSKAALINPATFSESLLYCTVKITAKIGSHTRSGTGFIFDFVSGANSVPTLITNTHVIENATEIKFRIHTQSKDGPPDGNIEITAPGSTSGAWVTHPDENVDLCGIPIGGVLNSMKPPAFIKTIGTNIIPTDEQLKELDALEEVVMVGYPISLTDNVNNYPVMRRGITATAPLVDFEGKPIFVVDMACFPGSSGSPVFLYNAGSYPMKGGGLVAGSRAYFLGVLYATPVYTPDGKVQITEAPTALQGSVSLSIPINLGYVIKAREVMALRRPIFQKYKVAL